MINEIARGIAIFTVAAGLIGFTLYGARCMGSVLVGGALTYFNFVWLSALVKELLTGQGESRFFGIKLAAKGISLFMAVGVLVALKLVDALPFIVGLSSLFASVLFAGLRLTIKAGKDRDS